MKHYLRFIMVAAMPAMLFMSPVFADDAQKIRDLERAISTPVADTPAPKKLRTRAIVFDSDEKPATDTKTPDVAGNINCSDLPIDSKSVAIDFSIQFKLGSAQISPASEKMLKEIAKVLALSNKCVLVEVHTDATGNVDQNNVLSKARADSVVNYIVEQSGLDRKRLVPTGKGSSEPLQNLNPRNPNNRRVVFKVVG